MFDGKRSRMNEHEYQDHHDVYDFEEGEVFFQEKQFFQEKLRIDREAYSLLKLVYTDDNGDYTLNVFIKTNEEYEHQQFDLDLSMKNVMDVLCIHDTGKYDVIEVYLKCNAPDTTTFHISHLLKLYDNSNEKHNQTHIHIGYVYYGSETPVRLDIGSFLGEINSDKRFNLVMDNVVLIDRIPSRKESTDRIKSIDTDRDYDEQIIRKYFGWEDIQLDSDENN